MLKRIVSSVNASLIFLSALTVQADDVSIKNPTKHSVQFRVFIASTGYDKTITLKPGEAQNAIGTDLWHNAIVEITGVASAPGGKDCHLSIYERSMISSEEAGADPFYLPEVISEPGYPACQYTSNLPDCYCFAPWSRLEVECYNDCTAVTNAQVVVSY